MATTTDSPLGNALPLQHTAAHRSRPSKSQSHDPLAAPRTLNIPPPIPHFVFPMRPEPAAPIQRRPHSAMGPETMGSSYSGAGKSHPALPAFSFNPGAGLLTPEKNNFLSPPESPLAPQNLTSPPSPRTMAAMTKPGHRHRRGGSEFVGGSIRGGDSITVLGISPTKSESGFDVPADLKLPSASVAGRRGHAHRRSAAISSHDVSKIMVPIKPIDHGYSAPNSPTNFDRQEIASLDAVATAVMDVTEDQDATPVATPTIEEPIPDAVPRSRVGFADTVEVIPRPLSVVSTDTVTTITASHGHTLSASMSSIVTNLATVNDEQHITVVPAPSSTPASVVSSPTRPKLESRPSTAGAILDQMSKQGRSNFDSAAAKRRNSIPTLLDLPGISEEDKAALHNIKSPKRWSFFGLDTHKVYPSAVISEPSSRKQSTETAVPTVDGETADVEEVPNKKKKKKKKKKTSKTSKKSKMSKSKGKGKGKGWTVPILGRKSKTQLRKSVSGGSLRITASTTQQSPQASTASLEDCIAPDSNEVMDPEVITTPVMANIPTIELPDETPKQKRSDEDSSIAMIDLDAALGPFNTPLSPNPEWEAAQRAAGNVKRKLHSAQGMKGFSGPGMHYHRRADSAPEMVHFDRSAFGVHRFGSNSTMADVFEEDEEDDDEAIESDSSSSRSADITPTGRTPPIQHASSMASMATTADDNVPATPSGPRVSGMLALPSEVPVPMMKTEASSSSLKTDIFSEDIIYAPRGSAFATDSPSSSIAPSPGRLLLGKDLAPVNVSPLQLPATGQTPTSVMSSFPSPMSPVSYDAQCLSTAPSSLSDENTFQSLLRGEPGPEVRISVDIPSLTSTNSAGTRESVIQYSNRPNPTFREERPVSVSSAFGRRRSSLASLSRLINSSHGERSKLSMEMSLSEYDERKNKPSRAKRISRLVQFWKPRESSN